MVRHDLIGYLLDALEPDERQAVETALRSDAELQRSLELLHESLEPLRGDDEQFDPPPGLKERTCLALSRCLVAGKIAPARAAALSGEMMSRVEAPPVRSRFSIGDFAVAAGIFFAASMVLFPALVQSRENARIAGCQNNLRQLGQGLTRFASFQGGFFPAVPVEGKGAVAGSYAVHLNDAGLLEGPQQLICPGSPQAEKPEEVRVATWKDIERANETLLADLERTLGGSYGYNLGYMHGGRYQKLRNQGRSDYALMSDAPSCHLEARQTANHRGNGQNVLFEDGHVRYLTHADVCSQRDQLFLNDEGNVAAGKHPQDVVIGPSFARPLIRPVGLER